MEQGNKRQFAGIRIQREILHQARVAAVIQKKTMGQWLEEAIVEKIEKEKEK
jgi:predicted HicB family RNase H-like nuclease